MKTNKNENKNEILLNDNPKSSFSESIKSIRANLKFSDLDGGNKVILMTSANPSEGKSFITANLACSFAKDNKKVLIIDADLRKGRQHRIFGIPNNKHNGYSNMIVNVNKDGFSFDGYINKTDIPNLDFINLGATPPSPTELLSSDNNKLLLEFLKRKYDYIFLDCPPVLGLSDTLILSRISDFNIVVVSNKQTKMEQLLDVKKAFEKAGSNITGVVLNKVDKKRHGYCYGYYGYYGE